MPALTAMFSASVSWRSQAVKNTVSGRRSRQRLAQRVGGGQVRADRDHAGAGLDRGPGQGDDLPAVRGEQVDQGRSGDAGGAGDQGGPGGVLVRHDATLSCRREAAGRHADPPRYAAGGQPVGTGGARLVSAAARRPRGTGRALVILGPSPPEGIPVATLVSERIGQFFVDGDRLEYTEYGARGPLGRPAPRPADAAADARAAGPRDRGRGLPRGDRRPARARPLRPAAGPQGVLDDRLRGAGRRAAGPPRRRPGGDRRHVAGLERVASRWPTSPPNGSAACCWRCRCSTTPWRPA